VLGCDRTFPNSNSPVGSAPAWGWTGLGFGPWAVVGLDLRRRGMGGSAVVRGFDSSFALSGVCRFSTFGSALVWGG